MLTHLSFIVNQTLKIEQKSALNHFKRLIHFASANKIESNVDVTSAKYKVCTPNLLMNTLK